MIGALCAAAILYATAAPSELPFETKMQDLAAAKPALVQIVKVGASRAGRDIKALWLTDTHAGGDSPAPADRPALVIVAGLNAMHRVGIETAIGVAERLAAEQPDLLKTVSIYIVPCANPDTFAWRREPGHPAMDWGRTIDAYDGDHDGRIGEDPAEDLNGDGVISMMRIKNPAPSTGLKAEWAADKENPKLLKKPDTAKGEKAEYALLIEGIDNDGDGRFNEDGLGGSAGGGTDLDLNFPYRWPEFQDGAGRYPLSEPESLALVTWMLSQKNIAAVLVYGPGDTLINIPQSGKMDPTNQVPLGIEEGDKAAYEEIAKAFKEATNQTGAPALEAAGTFEGWAYAQYGVLSFETPVWVRPDLIKKEEPKKEGDKKDGERKDGETDRKDGEPKKNDKADDKPEKPESPPKASTFLPVGFAQPPVGQPGGGGRRRGGPPPTEAPAPAGEKKPEASDDAKWFKYDQDRVKAGDKSGFIDWHPFKHPQLGDVEIGGWMPGFKLNPPDAELPRLVSEQTRFIVSLLSRFPRLVTEGPWVERVGPGLWRISVRITNDGYLASMSAIGAKTRRGLPTILAFDGPLERLVSGEKISRTWSIPGSGGRAEATWLISGNEGDVVKLDVHPSIGPRRSVEVTLKEAGR